MTEADWNSCTDPQPMLEFLRGKVSDRKLRLFAVACIRPVLQAIWSSEDRVAIEIAERFVEGEVSKESYLAVSSLFEGEPHWRLVVKPSIPAYSDCQALFMADPWEAAYSICRPVMMRSCTAYHQEHKNDHGFDTSTAIANHRRCVYTSQVAIIRDIFGDPFHPAPLNNAWLTPTVLSLAQAIYNDRTFDRMPILADALEEAGCTDASILEHCRSGGEHVRGCWMVDLVLGKE